MTPLRAYRRMACDVCHTRNVTAVRMGIDYVCHQCCVKAADLITASDQEAAQRQLKKLTEATR